MFGSTAPEERLDPRKRARNIRRRDWASGMAMISVPRVRELLTTVLVRIGLVR